MTRPTHSLITRLITCICPSLSLVIISISLLLLASCGGGSGGGTPPPPPPPPPSSPDFSLSVNQSIVTVQQQGAYQYQTVQVNPLHGFNAAVSIAISNLPTGVAITPPGPFQISASPVPQSVSFQLSASKDAIIGSAQLEVTATGGGTTHTATFSVAVTAIAPFIIQATPQHITVGPASTQTVELSVTANPGTSPSLRVNTAIPPPDSDIDIFGPQGFLTPSNPVHFVLQAGVLAQPLENYPLVVTASDDGGNASVVVVPLTVSVPVVGTMPTRSSFRRTDQDPTGIAYDPRRKLIFVSVEILNEVIALSSVDGHRVASIPVSFPAGIDVSADGTAVYAVSPYSPFITTIDLDRMEIVRQSRIPHNGSGFEVAALANGKVLILPTSPSPSGQPYYVWTPATDVFTEFGQPSFATFSQVMTRSADRSKVLIYGVFSTGATAVLYDVATNSFRGPSDLEGVYQMTVSPDGSQVLGVGLQGNPTQFCDGNFNLLGSIPLAPITIQGSVYSLDGARVFVAESDLSGNNFVAALDTQNFSLIGVVPSFDFEISLPFSGLSSTPFAIDETGMIFGGVSRGVGYLDVSSPGFPNLPFSSGSLLSPTLMSLSTPKEASLNGASFSSAWNYVAYFGAPPASPQTLTGTNLQVHNINVIQLTVPAGTVAGPANMTLTRSDGLFQVLPDAVSYGPTVLQVDANAGSSSGGDTVSVVGYGFDGSNVQVTIGGRQAENLQLRAPIQGQFFPTERLTFKTPAGTSGYADLTVSTVDGSATVPGGFQYLSTLQTYPVAGALDDLVYDQGRQRIYLSNEDHNRVEVFDLATLRYVSPISVGKQPTTVALTTDGARLGVINFADRTMSVIDPGTSQVLSTFSIIPAQNTACDVPLTMSAVTSHRMLVSLACPGTLGGGVFHLVNVDTGDLTCTGVAGCQPNGTDMFFGNCCGLGSSASTPDGRRVFLVPQSGISGTTVAMLDLITNTVISGYAGTYGDVAANADGNVFASSFGIANDRLDRLSIIAFEPYAEVGVQSGHNVIGEKLNPSGSLLYVPQDSGVTIFDVHTGRLVQHIAISDGIPLNMNAMVLDEIGTKMFLISNSGLTIAQLFQSPLSLATVNPASGSPGTKVKLRGSGFQNGTTVTFGQAESSVTYVDPNTLTATVPASSPGPVRITIANPGGITYSLDDAFAIQ